MRKVNGKTPAITDDILEMALHGYQNSLDAIEQKISSIRKMLGGGGRAIAAAVDSYTTAAQKGRRTMSAAGRKRIAAAQKKRWANVKKTATATVKTARKKAKTTVKAAKAKVADLPSL